MPDFLTESDLVAYTHLKQSAAQARWLSECGIPYHRRRDGTVAVTWTQINNQRTHKTAEPNYDAA
jgi:hypothetical protein